jgi:predicted nucleic acid-binding protein
VVTDRSYIRPYFDSGVFISWILGSDPAKMPDGSTVDRSPISEHVLAEGEAGAYAIITSYFTIAEVHKKRGHGVPALTDDQNGKILAYFENEFLTFVEVDRGIGEDANRLCQKYRQHKLSPADAIHLASAVRAGSEVLLTWDGPLAEIRQHDGIRIEFPRIIARPVVPKAVSLFGDDI